jgi:hypothetical protein
VFDDDCVEKGRDGVEDPHVEAVAEEKEDVTSVAQKPFDGARVPAEVGGLAGQN